MVSIGYSFQTKAELKARSTTDLVTGYLRFLVEEKAWYVYLSSATDVADEVNIIAPNSGVGRWFKTISGIGLITSSNVSDFVETVQDTISGTLSSTAGSLTYSYNDTNGTITASLKSNSVSNLEVATNAAIAQNKIANLVTDLANKSNIGHNHSSSEIIDFVEAVADRVAATLVAGSNISLNYDDNAGTLSVSANVEAVDALITVQEDGVDESTSVSTLNFTGAGVDVTVTGNTANISISGGGGSGGIGTTITCTSSSLTPLQSETVAKILESNFFTTYRIDSDYPARIRGYIDSASALADLNRPADQFPSGEHGLLFEVVTIAANLSINLSPVVVGYTLNSDTLYITFTNLDSVSRAITTNLYTL